MNLNFVLLVACVLAGNFFGLSFSSNQIIVVGQTGTGKSYLVNRLAAAGEETVEECDGDSSCTIQLTSRVAFNGEAITEVPGYLDTSNRDNEIQAAFVDFLKKKTIRAVVFVYTNRADAFMKAAASAFLNSELRNNLIFVKNKVNPNTPDEVSVIDDFPDIPKISVKWFQNDLSTLKNVILGKIPVTPNYLIVPVSLFRLPLEIVRDEVVEIFIEEKSIMEKVTLRSRVPNGRIEHCRWSKPEWLSKCCTGSKDCWEEQQWRDVVEEKLVAKPYRVFEKLKLTYAKRFDAIADVYSKQHLGFDTIPIS